MATAIVMEDGSITDTFEIRYGNDYVSMMFRLDGSETTNPCECVEYLNKYNEMIKMCGKKQFHIAFI